MTEVEQKALALLASIERSLAELASQRPARAGASATPMRRVWTLNDEPIDDRPDHRTLQRGEPARRSRAQRWPR